MNISIEQIKGIHPGIILERELKIRNIPKGRFALLLNEYPQTIVSITKGKRRMNTPLAMKIEKELKFEEGFFMILQVFHDIELENKKVNFLHPDLSKLRPILFWDTLIEKIDWMKQKKAVIKRVFERGNENEKNEILNFYGRDVVFDILNFDGH